MYRTHSLRRSAVAGLFYPKSCVQINIYFDKFNALIDARVKENPIFDIAPRAIIVPHAGYIFSGFTANMAYKVLSNSNPKRAIVIGPSHKHFFEGISGSYYELYQSPCGDIPIDTEYLIALAKQFNIGFEPNTHAQEHSTEVQMPFVKHYLPNAKVIELIYGNYSPAHLSRIISYLLEDRENIVIISSDLSHFYSETKARELDHICMEGIAYLDNARLSKGCKACGLIGINALIESTQKLGLYSRLIDYRTSSDASGDTSSVVGYLSAVIYYNPSNSVFKN